MSKQCTICGNICEDSITFCPMCGAPVPPQQTAASQIQPQQTAASQDQPQQSTAPQVPPQQAMTPPPNYNPYGQPPYAQTVYPQSQPVKPKKKHTVLFIILGVVGGIVILTLIIVVVLWLLLGKLAATSPNSPGTSGGYSSDRYESDNHNYYYPDYEQADMNSEDYTSDATSSDNETTEAASEESASTEAPISSEVSQPDLNLHGYSTSDEVIPLTMNSSYVIPTRGTCTAVSLITNEAIPMNPDSKYVQFSTAKGIIVGSNVDDLVTAYGIDSTNAAWIMTNGTSVDSYYYSTIAKPEFNDEHTYLAFGWYEKDNTWTRMSAGEINNLLCNAVSPDCTSIILYQIEATADYTVKEIKLDYCSPEYAPHYYSE